MLSVLATLGEWLHHPEQRRLRREFALWVQRVLLHRKPFDEQAPRTAKNAKSWRR
ncbi:MAG: hypothetical protein ACLFMS_04445 [Halorhodospira sp.]